MSQDSIGRSFELYGRAPLLSKRNTLELARVYKAGTAEDATPGQKRAATRAKERLITSNMRLVITVAKKYQRRALSQGLGMDDLVQEGSLGLSRAVEKYDVTTGYSLTTYSYWWIRQSISRAIEVAGTIRVASAVRQTHSRLQWALSNLGPNVTFAEACDYAGLTEEKGRETLAWVQGATTRSLDYQPRNGHDDSTSSLAELIAAPENGGEQVLAAIDYQLAIERLEARRPDDLAMLRDSLRRPSREIAAEQGITTTALKMREAQARKRLAAVAAPFRELVEV